MTWRCASCHEQQGDERAYICAVCNGTICHDCIASCDRVVICVDCHQRGNREDYRSKSARFNSPREMRILREIVGYKVNLRKVR